MALQVVFAGYLISEQKIPRWLIEFFWLSPMSWVMRALAVNEVTDPAYDVELPLIGNLRAFFLRTYEIRPERYWMWAAVIYLFGFMILCTGLSAVVLARIRYDRSIGTSRTVEANPSSSAPSSSSASASAAGGVSSEDPATVSASASAEPSEAGSDRPATSVGEAAVVVVEPEKAATSSSSVHSTLPFAPMRLSFRDICYDVTLSQKDEATGSK